MNGLAMMGKLSAITAILIFLTALQPLSASALEPVFKIRAKDGHTIVGAPFQMLSGVMDPENYCPHGDRIETRNDNRFRFETRFRSGLRVLKLIRYEPGRFSACLFRRCFWREGALTVRNVGEHLWHGKGARGCRMQLNCYESRVCNS